ncbi:urea carboxylase-associated family protein [Streptomyces sp. NPDC001073]|uniref:urea carboxylase-associated family protein n=1 Tax=Streptomyces sp. NPDC001642 TaxID=3154392 RepID=UPI0033344566
MSPNDQLEPRGDLRGELSVSTPDGPVNAVDGRRSQRVPAQGGRAVVVRAGETVEITDIEGRQVGDLWAIDAADHRKWLSTSHTRDLLEQLFPRVGECFVDQQYEPVLEFVRDSSPGMHDMLFPACNPALYEREGLTGHPNCADNFTTSLAALGIALPVVPDPVNFFQNSEPGERGRLDVLSAATLPGDSVVLRAVREVVLVLTACSVDFWPTNGDRCGPLGLDVYPGEGEGEAYGG